MKRASWGIVVAGIGLAVGSVFLLGLESPSIENPDDKQVLVDDRAIGATDSRQVRTNVPQEVVTVGEVAGPKATMELFLNLSASGSLDSDAGMAILTDEFSDIGATFFKKGHPVLDHVARIDEERAVARVTVMGESETLNCYFYLIEDSGWKIRCYRALALTGVLRIVLKKLEEDPRQGEPGQAANIKLTLSSDQELITWFHENRAVVERLASMARERGLSSLNPSREDPEVFKLLRSCHLSSVALVDEGSRVEVTVGGIVDNFVGFLHVENGDPPEISDDAYIWLESIGEGWYLFKTT